MFRKIVFALFLVSVLLGSAQTAKAETTSYGLIAGQSFYTMKQQFYLAISNSNTTLPAEVSIEIPKGIIIPGSLTCESGNACTYNAGVFQPTNGFAALYLWGYPQFEGNFIFTGTFKTSVAEEVITTTVHLRPVGYPQIDQIEIKNDLIIIYGKDFLPYEWGEVASQLQVWIVLPNGGVNWVAATTQGVAWDQDTITFKVPQNLPRGKSLIMEVHRGKYSSNKVELKLPMRVFLPLVTR